jgi:hypothetical protein
MAFATHTFQNAATATGNGTPLEIVNQSVLTLQVSGITDAEITPEGSVDGGTTWSPIAVQPIASGEPQGAIDADGMYRLSLPPVWFSDVRLRISSYTSGTITVLGRHGP